MVEMRHQLVSEDQWSGAGTGALERHVRLGRAAGQRSEAWQSAERNPLLSALAKTLRQEVLPRLVLAHRAMTVEAKPLVGQSVVWSDAVIELSKVVLHHDASAAQALVDAMILNGTSLEAAYLDLLAPTARRLGALWSDDVCDIADVTMGLWRLKEVMRALSPAFQSEGGVRDHGRSVLLIPAPGETHSFGLSMVSDFFTRDGWNVAGGPLTAGNDVGKWVRGTWFTMVGFSVGCDASLDALAEGIRVVRRSSRNRAVGVMVGGPVFALHPELAAQVGADATATDGRQAVLQAQSLVALLAGRQ